ncbi:MAG: flavodoxin domain-containing protein [Miniphocaeibacter sp.]|uniref:flavodoxin domain-containing protein n=1 Tax=Miniphocaeibacter sp. TaxID=3100973 RepID=UPI0017B67695|nr:flavodoxin [Gallicola sp.]
MNVLIVYSSKYGCTEKCVKYLENRIDYNVEIINLKKDKLVDLGTYDTVIIGSPIYMGKALKEVRNFCKKYLKLLLKKKVILFLCCTTPNKLDEFLVGNFSNELLSHVRDRINFGGEIQLEGMGFIDKQIVKMAEKLEAREIGMQDKNIEKTAELINNI